MQQLSNDSLQSKVISFLRFPLIVGVILIHTQLPNANEEFVCYENTKFIISNVIARIAVLLFFVCSGFLFFFKTEEFSLHTYLSKLKKRVKTLLIPYLIWNTLFIVAFNIRENKNNKVSRQRFSNKTDLKMLFFIYKIILLINYNF